MRSYRDTCFTAASPTFLLIFGTPGAAFSTTTTPISIENVKIYLVIAVFIRVNIVYK